MSQINPIELNNIRVLSTTFEKLMITISEEQADILREIIPEAIKTRESEEYGTSYTVVVKVCSDKQCDLYKTIKRRDVEKGLYDIVVSPIDWTWLDKTGKRLDAYFIRKNIPELKANPVLARMINPEVVDGTSREPVRKIRAPKKM